MDKLTKLIKDQERELKLTKHKDRIYPEVIPQEPPQLPDTRTLVRCLFEHHYTPKDISRVLHLSKHTVKAYLKKSYDKIKK